LRFGKGLVSISRRADLLIQQDYEKVLSLPCGKNVLSHSNPGIDLAQDAFAGG
jgi:hypothetical protein